VTGIRAVLWDDQRVQKRGHAAFQPFGQGVEAEREGMADRVDVREQGGERVRIGGLDHTPVEDHLPVQHPAVQLIEVDRVAQQARQALGAHRAPPISGSLSLMRADYAIPLFSWTYSAYTNRLQTLYGWLHRDNSPTIPGE